MVLDDCRVVPLHPVGAGRLARFDAVVCLVGPDRSGVATASLFEACRSHRGDGTNLIEKVDGIRTRAGGGAALPAFAVVVQDGDALQLAVHGSVTVVIEQPGGSLRLGGGVGVWETRRLLDVAYLSVSTAAPSPVAVPSMVDLRRGIAVADAFVVLTAGTSPGDVVGHAAPLAEASAEIPAWLNPFPLAPTPSPAPPPPAPSPVAYAPGLPGVAGGPPAPRVDDGLEDGAALDDGGKGGPSNDVGGSAATADSFKIVELHPDERAPVSTPLPVAESLAPSLRSGAGGSADEVAVRGVHCGRGHFNDPRARYCAVCGLAMFQNSMVLVDGPRPPLGVLLLNNGESYPLTRTLVMGRDPGGHPDVLAGRAEALVPATRGSNLSRVHASVRLHGWDVHLVDEGSTNGTFVWNEARRQWVRLVAQQPYVLRPGDEMALGELTATFETSLQQ